MFFLCKQHVCRLPGCMHFVLCSPFAVACFSLLFPPGLCLFTVCFLFCLSAVCVCLFWVGLCKVVLFCLLCLLVYQSGYLPNLVSALLICAVSLLFIVWRGLPVSLSARLPVFFWGALAWYCLLVFLPCVLLFVPVAFVCKSAVCCLPCACCPVLLCRWNAFVACAFCGVEVSLPVLYFPFAFSSCLFCCKGSCLFRCLVVSLKGFGLFGYVCIPLVGNGFILSCCLWWNSVWVCLFLFFICK